MKIINILFPGVALACLSLAAQATAKPLPGPSAVAATDCASKGCPRLDQHGCAPVSCVYNSGMATGWQCIVICTYKDTNWGTTVDSSHCN